MMLGRIISRTAYRASPLRQARPSFFCQVQSKWQSTAAVQQEESLSAPPASKPLDRKYKFFQDVEVTPEGVAIIRFDGPKKVNSISFDMSKEARKMWQNDIANNSAIKAVVFSSGKPDMFIAGADIFDLKAVENKQDLIGLIEDGMDFFQSMKDKKVPLVCAIDGPALGGGLEWAM
jgi:hypothetical protein